uniref:Secretory peptide n=1 Tax=Panagrellus redivivus TaxID=6233 RepID=A0A7E4V4R9_PANRE
MKHTFTILLILCLASVTVVNAGPAIPADERDLYQKYCWTDEDCAKNMALGIPNVKYWYCAKKPSSWVYTPICVAQY